jgi:hypothetical protein
VAHHAYADESYFPVRHSYSPRFNSTPNAKAQSSQRTQRADENRGNIGSRQNIRIRSIIHSLFLLFLFDIGFFAIFAAFAPLR